MSLDVFLIFLNYKHLHDSFDLLLINILFKFDFLLHSTLYHTKLSLPGTSCYQPLDLLQAFSFSLKTSLLS